MNQRSGSVDSGWVFSRRDRRVRSGEIFLKDNKEIRLHALPVYITNAANPGCKWDAINVECQLIADGHVQILCNSLLQ
jgi:hypothetical protein